MGRSFWINQVGLGAKKIILLMVILFFLPFLFAQYIFTVLLFDLVVVSFLACLVVLYGVSIRLASYKKNGFDYQVVVSIYPLDIHKSNKGVVSNGVFETVIPLFSKKKLMYLTFLRNLLLQLPAETETLVLGGSGGAIPKWLVENNKSKNVVSVEYSKEMIVLAKKYFLKELKDEVELIENDAISYLKQSKKFDFILLDIFEGELVSKKIALISFVKNLRKKAGSLLVVNFGGRQDKKLHLYFKIYKSVIPEMNIYLMGQNFIGIYTKDNLKVCEGTKII